MIFLDTNACIALINDKSSPLKSVLDAEEAAGAVVAVGPVVIFELRYGASKSGRPARNRAVLDEFIAERLIAIPFGPDDAIAAGDLRASLEKAGTPIGPYDLLIAAQALARGAAIVTRNIREFSRVPGLRVIDWSVP